VHGLSGYAWAGMKAVAVLAVVAFAVLSVSVKNELRRERSPVAGLTVGQPMPGFTLKDLSGSDVSLDQVLKDNKVVAINFWASWCGPCRLEMPGFEKLYEKRRTDGFVILGINEDQKPGDMADYLRDRPVTFPVLLDSNGELLKRLGLEALPTTILVGRNGKILMVVQGVMPYLSAFIEAELKNAQTAK
jgi:cytochrome c biogenesis protein CcmG/thiol:disulfide interchange protein DsbE